MLNRLTREPSRGKPAQVPAAQPAAVKYAQPGAAALRDPHRAAGQEDTPGNHRASQLCRCHGLPAAARRGCNDVWLVATGHPSGSAQLRISTLLIATLLPLSRALTDDPILPVLATHMHPGVPDQLQSAAAPANHCRPSCILCCRSSYLANGGRPLVCVPCL